MIHAFPSEIYPTKTAAWVACLGGDPWAIPSPTAFAATIQTRARRHCRPVYTTTSGRQTFPTLGVSERISTHFTTPTQVGLFSMSPETDTDSVPGREKQTEEGTRDVSQNALETRH